MSLSCTTAPADNDHSITTVVEFLKIISCSSTGDMFAENYHSVAIYSRYSVTTVESTVVLLKSKRSFCKSLVATKLLGKCHSTGDMFSFRQCGSGGCSLYLNMCRENFVLKNFQKLGF